MALVYMPSANNWGLYAKDGNTALVFSGTLNPARICKNFFNRLLLKPQRPMVSGDAVDIFQLFSPAAKKIWNRAVWMAINQGPLRVGCVHIFLSLTEDPSVQTIFFRFGADLRDARTLLKNYMKLSALSAGSEELKHLPFAAFEESEKLHSPSITPLMLLAALVQILSSENILQAVFDNLGLTLTKLEVLAVWLENLNYGFPDNNFAAGLLHCFQRVQWLEQQNRITFKLNAVEQALTGSANNPKEALKLLVRAATSAKQNKRTIIASL